MGYLLLTNDDGLESPALVPFAKALGALASVRVVVPEREKSWVGKAITRWDPIEVRPVEREGVVLHGTGGFPADCTNLGVHSLFEERPEMVVSGVNIGLNHGLAFFLSSGTVGAAIEGWIAGLPAIALSVGSPRDHARWSEAVRGEDHVAYWEGIAKLAADLLRDVREAGFPEGVDLLSVNFPAEAGPDTPRAVTRLAAVGYDNLFRRDGDGLFVHDFSGGFRTLGPLAGTDLEAVDRGWISITPIRLAHDTELPEAFRRRLGCKPDRT